MAAATFAKKQKSIQINKPISREVINPNSIEAMTRETDKMVTGTFINIECPGQPAKVSGKYYKEMVYFTQVFKDNEKCTIPLSVARFINERCYHDRHSHLLDSNGMPIKSGNPQYRYKFTIENYN